MKFHIVRNGESIDDIVFLYGLEPEELKKENKHIRSWDNIIPGTKLRIPTITEAVELDVISMEPFIEDYYPKLKLGDDVKQDNVEEYGYQEVDNYVVKSTKNNNIQDSSQINTKDIVEPIEIEIAPIKEKPKQDEKKVIPKKLETTKEDEEDEEIVPVQQVYYPYYPYYVYNRYPSPQLVYPVYVYPNRPY